MSFWVNQCVFSLSVLHQVLPTLSPCCLSVRLFCYVRLVAIFFSKIVQIVLHLFVGMFYCNLRQPVGRIFFRCFGMLCFVCIVCWCLFNLPSYVRTFWFISPSRIVIFSCVGLSFWPQKALHFSFALSFLPVFVAFLSTFPAEFPIQVLIFCLWSSKEPRFSPKVILLLHRLVHLIRLCFLLSAVHILKLERYRED